ncbi:MAG: FAD binding domain-containing protein [Thermodesulfobacteriota bacterium]
MKKFDYHMPESLKEAYGLMEKQKGRARYIAGGTDVIVRVKQRAIEPEALISLRHISDLRGVHWNGGLRLGSMTILRDLERDEGTARDFKALHQAVRVLANPQVRNVATIGGNLANAAPSADCAPPLLVLGAKVEIDGPGGGRVVPLEAFFTGPGQTCLDGTEVIKSVIVPGVEKGTGTAFLKDGRVSQDIALINAAALVVMEGGVCKACRLAAGAVAPVPLRLKETEKAIEGREITPDVLEEIKGLAEKEVSPITDVRTTAEYRRIMSGVLIKRAVEQAARAAG